MKGFLLKRIFFAHLDFLASLSLSKNRCFNCGKLLKLWPSRGELQYFQCNGKQCPARGHLIQNNDTNRLTCFGCDFNLCSDCTNEQFSGPMDPKHGIMGNIVS